MNEKFTVDTRVTCGNGKTIYRVVTAQDRYGYVRIKSETSTHAKTVRATSLKVFKTMKKLYRLDDGREGHVVMSTPLGQHVVKLLSGEAVVVSESQLTEVKPYLAEMKLAGVNAQFFFLVEKDKVKKGDYLINLRGIWKVINVGYLNYEGEVERFEGNLLESSPL